MHNFVEREREQRERKYLCLESRREEYKMLMEGKREGVGGGMKWLEDKLKDQ